MGKLLSVLMMGVGIGMTFIDSSAQAASPLNVLVDRSQLLQLSGEAGTIIVGNPSIADVSLNGRQLFIHGHSAGETNLMVFDQAGKKIADYDLSVTQDGDNSLIVFTGTSNGSTRMSYVCAPNCERSMAAADPTGGNVVQSNSTKFGFAQATKGTVAPAAAPVGQ